MSKSSAKSFIKKYAPSSVKSYVAQLKRYVKSRRKFKLSPAADSAARARLAAIAWPAKGQQKIIYALTPTANLKNVGDQAQVVAILRWLAKHYPALPVVEIDKDIVVSAMDEVAAHVSKGDLVFLHSGGNLGDRGLWSETGRRAVIRALPDNQVVSLPQTIYFSDTPNGRRQQAISADIYQKHGRLTVMGRDQVSGEVAQRIFPRAQVITMPDFVLSLTAGDFVPKASKVKPGSIMACLRLDDESAYGGDARDNIVRILGSACTVFDTTLPDPIPPSRREPVLAETLALFAAHETVVTDRFHGLIFAILCRKPTVVLRTVDHKLTSAMDWFKDIANVEFCEKVEDLPLVLAKVKAAKKVSYPDFNALYFDRLPGLLSAR